MFRLLSTIFIVCNLDQFTMAGEWVESYSLTLVMREEGRVDKLHLGYLYT